MGGTFIRLVQQGHDVHVAYETSGNVAVHDDVVLQNIDTSRELGYGDHYAEVGRIIAGKKKGEPEPRALLDLKGSIRRAEARAAVRSFGLNPDTNAHFLNLPFYETQTVRNPAKFKEQHRAEFAVYEAACAYFKANGLRTLPDLKKLDAEYQTLSSEKNGRQE